MQINKQITIDNNSIVQQCSIGGLIENGINVDNIPDAVFDCPSKWIYADEVFADETHHATYSINPDYAEPTAEDVTPQDEYNLDFDFRLTCLELGI